MIFRKPIIVGNHKTQKAEVFKPTWHLTLFFVIVAPQPALWGWLFKEDLWETRRTSIRLIARLMLSQPGYVHRAGIHLQVPQECIEGRVWTIDYSFCPAVWGEYKLMYLSMTCTCLWASWVLVGRLVKCFIGCLVNMVAKSFWSKCPVSQTSDSFD